jgi:hypothetical protein
LALAFAAALPCLVTASADIALAKGFDCYPAIMPPASYASKPFKGKVQYHYTTASAIRQLNSRLTGMAAGNGYCDGPLALTVPENDGSYDIYLPVDVSQKCKVALKFHEDAHAKGWEHGDPGSTYHTGICANPATAR